MNVFMGYNPTVAKQVKVTVWVKEIDGAEPIFPATPKDGDCFIVFDTDDDVLADNPSSKKSYANGSWGDVGGGGGGDFTTATITFINNTEDSMGTLFGAFAEEEEGLEAMYTEWGVTRHATDEISLALFKGRAFLGVSFHPSAEITTSGDVKLVDDDLYLVTGDCTLTAIDSK